MKRTIGIKVGTLYGGAEELIEKLIKKDVNFFEINTSDILDIDFFINHKKRGIGFGLHMPHSFFMQNPVSLCATIEPYKSMAKKWFKKSIEIANKIKPEYIIFHPDIPIIPKGNVRYPEGIKFAQNKKEGFKQLIENIKNYNGKVPLLAEVMPGKGYFNHNLSESLKIKKLSNIGFCFDIEHAFRVEDDFNIMNKWYKGISDLVKTFHICDYNPSQDNNPPQTHLPVGEGIIDFKKFFKINPPREDQILILEILPHSEKTIKDDLFGSKEKIEKILEDL